MKYVFRLGFILLPFLFLISTTAYSAQRSDHVNRSQSSLLTSRSPASVAPLRAVPRLALQLGDVAVSGDTSMAQASKSQIAGDFRSLAPEYGRGLGIQAAVIRFR